MTKGELEALIRALINNGDEYDKLELKSSYDLSIKKDRIRLVKCIAAIANTDCPSFDNIGYIVLGAKRGKLIGAFDALEKDSTSADIHGWVRDYVDPKIDFTIERFIDESVGWWGVIVIPPSSETHVMKKDFRVPDFAVRMGEIYVRHGDSIHLADRTDIDRLQRRKFKTVIDDFKNEMGALKREITELKSSRPDLKLFLLDDKNNRLESLEVQPILWEKTKEQLQEEASNEASINKLEKELTGLTHAFLTTQNAKKTATTSEGLRDELQKRKTLRYEYNQNCPTSSRIIELRFLVWNNGSTAANGIKVYVYFSPSVELSATKSSFLRDVEYPLSSQAMQTLSGFMSASSLMSPQFPVSPPAPDFVNPKSGGPDITKNEQECYSKYWIEKLMQGHGYTLDPIYLMASDHNLDTTIDYGIYAENAPGVARASLQLIIRPKRKEPIENSTS